MLCCEHNEKSQEGPDRTCFREDHGLGEPDLCRFGHRTTCSWNSSHAINLVIFRHTRDGWGLCNGIFFDEKGVRSYEYIDFIGNWRVVVSGWLQLLHKQARQMTSVLVARYSDRK